MNMLVVMTGAWCAAAVVVGVAVGGWLRAAHRSLDIADDWVLWECELAATKADEPAARRSR